MNRRLVPSSAVFAAATLVFGAAVASAQTTQADQRRPFGPAIELPPSPAPPQPGVEQPQAQPTASIPEDTAATSAPAARSIKESRPLGAAAPAPSLAPAEQATPAQTTGLGSLGIGRTAAALAGVVALALVAAAAVKAAARRRGGVALAMGPAGRAPSGVVHVLARYPLQRGQLLVLLKVGPRVLLACQSRQGRFGSPLMSTLAEFSDPDEVASLVRLTQDTAGESATNRFRSVLDKANLLPMPAQTRAPEPRSAPSQVLVAPSGDRAEFSAKAQANVHTGFQSQVPPAPRPRAPRGFVESPQRPAARPNPRATREAVDLDLDGAEQLRRRLAQLRSGGRNGEAS